MIRSGVTGLVRATGIAAGLWSIACQSGHAVYFQGYSEPAVVPPEHVLEAPALPRGARRLGRLLASCEQPDEWAAFRDRSLLDVDCTKTRLQRMLREAAARQGGDVLVGLTCDGNGGLACRAELGRNARRASAERPVFEPDIRGTHGAEVRVDFSPVTSRPQQVPRDEQNVGDLPVLPPSHQLLGSLSTACDACSELETRDALRIAAGRLGASDVVGVRCLAWGPGFQCAGSAAVPEHPP